MQSFLSLSNCRDIRIKLDFRALNLPLLSGREGRSGRCYLCGILGSEGQS